MRDPETGRFVKRSAKVPLEEKKEKPKVSLLDKAKARRERLGHKRSDGMAKRDPSLPRPRRSIIHEITKRGRNQEIR